MLTQPKQQQQQQLRSPAAQIPSEYVGQQQQLGIPSTQLLSKHPRQPGAEQWRAQLQQLCTHALATNLSAAAAASPRQAAGLLWAASKLGLPLPPGLAFKLATCVATASIKTETEAEAERLAKAAAAATAAAAVATATATAPTILRTLPAPPPPPPPPPARYLSPPHPTGVLHAKEALATPESRSGSGSVSAAPGPWWGGGPLHPPAVSGLEGPATAGSVVMALMGLAGLRMLEGQAVQRLLWLLDKHQADVSSEEAVSVVWALAKVHVCACVCVCACACVHAGAGCSSVAVAVTVTVRVCLCGCSCDCDCALL